MTGYEMLKVELNNRFSVNKVNANEAFIKAIIEILAEDKETKIALSLADKEKAEAKEILKQAKRSEEEACYIRTITEKKEDEIETKEMHLKEMEEAINKMKECETAEARDKIRLAEYFDTKTAGEREESRIRGFSNILGNGGMKNNKDNYGVKNKTKESDIIGSI